MFNKKIVLCTTLIPFSTIPLATAEESSKLNEVLVTAGYAEVNQVKPTKKVIVIQGKDIQDKGYQNLEDVLDDVASINVGKSGLGTIDIRGQGDEENSAMKNIQVMLDGAPITTLSNHPYQTDYNVVPVEHIEKIEIIPGGGAIIYGSGSVGGIVNITTNLKNIYQTKKSLNLSVGTNNKNISAHLGHNFNDHFSAQLAYTRLEKDLYFKDTYRNSNYITAGLNYKFNDDHNVSLRYSNLSEKGQFVGNIQNQKLDKLGRDYVPRKITHVIGLDKNNRKITTTFPAYSNTDRQMKSLNATYTGFWDNINYNLDLFYNKGFFINNYDDNKAMKHKTIGMKNKLNVEYGRDSHFADSSILFGLDLFKQNAILQYNDYELIEWKGQRGEDSIYKIKPLSFKYDKTTFALYALNNLRYKKFDFSQGVRLDKTYWKFDKERKNDQGKGTSIRKNINYSFGVAYNYNDTGKIYAHYERTFTSPDGQEINDSIPNQPLTITKGEDTIYKTYEIGFNDQFGFVNVDLVAFYSSTKNEMKRSNIFSPTQGLTSRSFNILKTKRKGVELNLSEKFGKLTLEQSYAYLKGVRKYNGRENDFLELGDIIDWTDAGLRKVPKHKLVLKAKYDFNEQWSASAKYNYSGKYTNFINEKDFKPTCYPSGYCGKPKFEKKEDAYIKSYSTVDINIRYKNKKGLSVSAGVNNLFNKKYFEYSGGKDRYSSVLPAEERSYYLDMRYTF